MSECKIFNPKPLSWEECFMSMAIVASYRSKDPSTKVGAVIVSKNNRVVSTGYNGFPFTAPNIRNNDDLYPWGRDGEESKYDFVVHAEANAITAGVAPGSALYQSKLFTTLFPCNECAKLIAQSGIGKVYYLFDKYKNTKSCKVSRKILKNAGVKLIEFKSVSSLDLIEIRFEDDNPTDPLVS